MKTTDNRAEISDISTVNLLRIGTQYLISKILQTGSYYYTYHSAWGTEHRYFKGLQTTYFRDMPFEREYIDGLLVASSLLK